MSDKLDEISQKKTQSRPAIYAFKDPHYPGLLNVGYTTMSMSERFGDILTFKPAVQSAWEEDLARHIDFEGWQFIANGQDRPSLDEQYEAADKSRPIVCFGSFQDFLGTTQSVAIKAKNEWVHAIGSCHLR